MELHDSFEIGSDVYCLRVAPTEHFCYNSFLIEDDHPILIHTGRAKFFPQTLALARRHIEVSRIAFVAFSHFEADECGALNEWLQVAPNAVPLVGAIGKASIEDFAIRPPRCVEDEQLLTIGRHTVQVLVTPHFPHGWDACLFYLPKEKILFSSDFGAQPGTPARVATTDLSATILGFQEEIGFLSEGDDFDRSFRRLSALPIDLLATQHGSLLNGPAVRALFERMKNRPKGDVAAQRTPIRCS